MMTYFRVFSQFCGTQRGNLSKGVYWGSGRVSLSQQIEHLIRQRPYNAGEIKDATGADYPQIFTILRTLCTEGKALYYFTNNGTLTYRYKTPWERR